MVNSEITYLFLVALCFTLLHQKLKEGSAKWYVERYTDLYHANGSYRNCGFSIPIAYCFDQEGNDLLLSKDDIRTRIFDTETNSIKIAE